MNTHGPYLAIGRTVRQARKRQGMTRRQLVWWIREDRTLEVTATAAALMVRELEGQGEVMNHAVLRRILHVVGISQETVAGHMTLAESQRPRPVT